MPRPSSNIPETVSDPYPIFQESHIVSGFGRGSSELGIPTANIPINDKLNVLDTGIYFGWCKLKPNVDSPCPEPVRRGGKGDLVEFNNGSELKGDELDVLPMVMSIGWNPFYNNKEKAAEMHIMKKFGANFYGSLVEYNVLGYIRPELDYTTKEALIEDINIDIKIALESLQLPGYQKFASQLQ
ncbi:riboflavin kinase [[Candida] railenensis]|uniref:Riboflavin kinase n=1 Tax=[Candida] railenensis TaxID=45579 RepID=A0A9P0QQM5_9ASCO|nr:riboflavin kinase [[Candida] railenensis]